MNRAYVRVSTIEQNEARQVEALKERGIDKWYMEKISGKNAEREQLQLMLAESEPGDTIFVHDFSRLARSTKDLLDIVEKLNAKGVHLVSNKEALDTSTPTGKLLLTMIGAIAEFERTNMLERQKEGIAIARRNGRYKGCGRKKKVVEDANALSDMISEGISKTEMAIRLGVSRVTLYRMLREVAE